MADAGHRELRAALEQLAGGSSTTADVDAGDSYTAGGHPFYRVSVPDRRLLVRSWLSRSHPRDADELRATVESLMQGPSFEELTLGPMLLALRRDLRASVRASDVERWIDGLVGWAEIDTMCQNVFPAEQLLASWDEWQPMIDRLSVSENVNKRRASIVLLTGPVRRSHDGRLASAAFSVLDRTRIERDPLVTKAVSWLLRSLTEHHAHRVATYLDENRADLPAIALRETRRKLETGTKTGRSRRS